MARNDTVKIAITGATQLTNGDASQITLQNVGQTEFTIYPAVGLAAPDISLGGVILRPGDGFAATTIGAIFPGFAGANRVYATAKQALAQAFISHD